MAPQAAQWWREMGVMSYAELKLKDVMSGKRDLHEYKGFYWSEKMDGWHVIWDGAEKLYTKSGKLTLPAPPNFTAALPRGTAISGELVVKGGQATDVAQLRKHDGPWDKARLYAFDLPAERALPFSNRTKTLERIVRASCAPAGKSACPLRYLKQRKIEDVPSFMREFEDIVACRGKYARGKKKGKCFGEGVVLTRPDSKYVATRVDAGTRVKLKRREDTEGRVVGYKEGKSLRVCYTPSGEGDKTCFDLAAGLVETQRRNLKAHFGLGSLVKFSFRSVGKNGKPKEAVLLGARHKDDQ